MLLIQNISKVKLNPIISSIVRSVSCHNTQALTQNRDERKINYLTPFINIHGQKKYASTFMSALTGRELWNSVTGVSNAGRKRGRARANRRNYAKDLNRGQVAGRGVNNMLWAGLNSRIIASNKIQTSEPLPEDEERMKRILDARGKMGKPKKYKNGPLERGFSGGAIKGKRFGPPQPFGDCTFEDFESVLLYTQRQLHMTGTFGRVYTTKAHVIIGNGNGIIGYGMHEGQMIFDTLEVAKQTASKNLFGIKLEGNTIPSSFVSEVHCSKVYAEPQLPGIGLRCRNIFKAICEMAGIKDIRVKVSGSDHKEYLIKAFVQGLMKMKTLQELSDEKKLNIVDLSGYYPKLIAQPQTGARHSSDIPDNEECDVHTYTLRNVKMKPKIALRPVYTHHPSYYFHLKKMEHSRFNYRKRLRLKLHHNGEIKSWLTEKYPECLPSSTIYEGINSVIQRNITESGKYKLTEMEDETTPLLKQQSRYIDVY